MQVHRGTYSHEVRIPDPFSPLGHCPILSRRSGTSRVFSQCTMFNDRDCSKHVVMRSDFKEPVVSRRVRDVRT